MFLNTEKSSGSLAASLEAEDRFLEEDPQLRKAYLDRVNKDMMRALEGQFVIAQATRINVEGKEYLMFKDNLDPAYAETAAADACQ